MKEQVKAYWAVPRNRAMIMALGGMLLCLALLAIPDEHYAVSALPASEIEPQKPSPKERKFVQEIAAAPLVHLRDPFRPIAANVPTSLRENAPMQNSAPEQVQSAGNDKKKSAKPAAQTAKLRLAGVIGSGSRAIALIEYGAESRACSVGEIIGPYRVTDISGQSALLDGQGERFSLRVSR